MIGLERIKGHITEKRTGFAVILLLIVIALGGNYVYAKYFSESARWGVAIASGVYFTANYAAANEDFFEVNVSSNYMGNNYEYVFEVRNYENNLLFNESSVVIPYSVSFWLGETPQGATYSVVWQEQSNGLSVNQKVTFSGHSIAGGSANANPYTIKIDVTDSGNAHEAVPIYVEVKTDDGAIINKTLRGKMVLNNVSAPKNYIESQAFVISKNTTDDAEKFELMQKQSMFTYEIRTVGEVALGDITEKLKLSWNPTLLEIDLFDEAYLAWQESEEEATGTAPKAPYVDADGWYYITLDVMPYSAQTVNFLRGTGYAENIKDMSSLNNAIKAEKY